VFDFVVFSKQSISKHVVVPVFVDGKTVVVWISSWLKSFHEQTG